MGVDPGVRGGLAVLRADGTCAHLRAFRPDMTRGDFNSAVRCAVGELRYAGGSVAYLEQVQHITGDGAQGSFTFGRIYGWCEMALTAHGVTVRDVRPMMWQASLECLTGGDKNVSKRRAIALFPREKITHAVADALLISEYGRRRIVL
ncbi:MAG: hypothetical protein V4510_13560 [bacterium]